MPEISRGFLRDQAAAVARAESGLRKLKIAAMDTVADGITGRGVAKDDLGVPVTVEELIFTHFGIEPETTDSEDTKSELGSIGEQFDKKSWGQLFSSGMIPIDSSGHTVHAIDGSDERSWRANNPMWSYNPLQYRLERWNNGENATYIGKIVLPRVFSIEADLRDNAPQKPVHNQVKQHGLVLMTFSRAAGNAALSAANLYKPNIRWGVYMVEGLNLEDVSQVAGISAKLRDAKNQIHAAPEFELSMQ